MKSLARVGLRPSRNQKISFGVQISLVLLWLVYGIFLLATEPENSANDRHFIHYVFLALALGYLIFIVAQNTSIFGTQSYLEITPAYVVEKRGYFQPKLAIYLQDVTSIQMNNTTAKFSMRDGSRCQLDLKLVRTRKNLRYIRQQIVEVADKHGIPLTDTSSK